MLQEAERAENIEKQAELTAQWAIEPESILDPIYVRSSAALISKAVNFGIPVPAQRQDSEHYRRSGVTGDFIRFFPPEDLANDRSGRLTGGYAHCHELFLVARQEASQAGSARRRSDTPVRRAGHWMRDSLPPGDTASIRRTSALLVPGSQAGLSIRGKEGVIESASQILGEPGWREVISQALRRV